ncbi:MAG: hypothetical protein ACREKF_01360 [Candidatus Methylomirabilales bacterium]
MSARFIPEAAFEPPTGGKGTGSAKGAAMGFFGSIGGGIQSGNLLGLALGVALAPVIGLGGAIYGAVAAESAATVEKAEATLKNAFVTLNIQAAMRDRVLQVARQQTRRSFVPLPDRGPTASAEEVSYRSLASEGIDTILEISIPGLGIPGGGINPPLRLVVSARARLIRVADDAEIHARTWLFKGRTRKFADWAVNDAQPLRDELDRAYQGLAEAMVDELFLLISLPPRARDKT